MNIYTEQELSLLVKEYLLHKRYNKLDVKTIYQIKNQVRLQAKWFTELLELINIPELNDETYDSFRTRIQEITGKFINTDNVQFTELALKYLIKNYVFAQYTDNLLLVPSNTICINYLAKNVNKFTWIYQISKRLDMNINDIEHIRTKLWEWWFDEELPICVECGINKVSLETFFKPKTLCSSCIRAKYKKCFRTKKPKHLITDDIIEKSNCPDYIKNFIRKITYINKLNVLVLKPRWKDIINKNQNEFQVFHEYTSFIEWNETSNSLSRKIYCALHGLKEEPKCAYHKCNEVCSFKGLVNGYGKFCGTFKGCNVKYENLK